ncbi:hypothetical protein [Frankia sp. CiP3]|nr:hypothetical protein [Frankia sp. CiP3]
MVETTTEADIGSEVEHLSGHRLLCGQMIERLESDANAHVLTPDGS